MYQETKKIRDQWGMELMKNVKYCARYYYEHASLGGSGGAPPENF